MNKLALSLAASTLVTMPRAFASAPPAATTAAAPKPARVEPILTGVAKIEMPERASKRGSETKYPFDSLTEVGAAFGVKNKTAAQLSSIVSNANRKHVVAVVVDGVPQYETKPLTDEAGNVTNVPDTSKPKTTATKHFFAVDVDAALKAKIKGTALEGSTALVFRDK